MLLLKDIIYKHRNGASTFEINVPEMRFKAGVINAILGKNGSVKTTILNIIGGHIICEKGNINLFDKDITHQSAIDRHTATVFQTISLFPHVSVKENIELAIEPNALFKIKKSTKDSAQKIMMDFNLTTAGFVWIATRKAMEASFVTPTHDLGALIGLEGEARTDIHEEGSVQVGKELWSARSESKIKAGSKIRVVRRDGFVVVVEKQE